MRGPDGAQYMTPPQDFRPSDDENEETFRRSRQRPACHCQPEYIPQRLRREVPNGREVGRPEITNVPQVNQDQFPLNGP
jgi:hypothetical protein